MRRVWLNRLVVVVTVGLIYGVAAWAAQPNLPSLPAAPVVIAPSEVSEGVPAPAAEGPMFKVEDFAQRQQVVTATMRAKQVDIGYEVTGWVTEGETARPIVRLKWIDLAASASATPR